MARKRDMRLQVLLVIALLLVLSGFAARCAAAEPLPGDPDATWTRYITREYGIEAQELGGLRRAGMTWPSIAAYLETLYPHETIVMDTDDFVELASGSGITPFESIETYKRALSHQTDPSWLANLYAETGSWGRIESAFDNRKQAYSLIDQDAFVSSSAAVPPQSMGEALSPLYGVSADSFDTAIRLGMDTEDIVDTMFMVELVSEDDMEKTANFNEAVYASRQLAPELLPLRQRWPVREFPRELLPLVPPSGVQGAAARQLPTARPISSGHIPKGMSAAGAGSNSSIVDPSILYGTERVSPFKAYFEGFAERVDPSSGALVVRQTDFVLPGRAGLDFALTRVYNSGLASFDIPRTKIRGIRDRSGSTDWEVWGEKIPNAFLEKRFGIGVGWRLAFPTIEFTDGQKYLHMDDGGVYKIGGGNYDDVGYYLVDYGVQDMVFSEDKSYTSPLDGAVSMYKLRRKDGVEWLFGSDGRLLCVRDRFGNEIKFQCQAPSGGLARIVKAVDTVGRQILFTYQADQVVVTVIPGDASSASTWTYKLESAGGNHSDRMKLAAVIPPAGRAVSYEYSTDGTTFTPHVPGAGTGSPVTLDYLNLVTIHHQGEARFNKSPGHTAQSCYEYEASHKSMNSGDPSKSDPSQLGYYRVVRRFDLVPTVDLSGGQPSSVIRREGEAEFVYADWNRSTLRYGCTRIAQMAAGEAGIAPARESWQFDKKHRLITHETTGADSGENRGLEEKISISYSYLGDDDKLISKEEKAISVGSAERSENTQYIWDGVGNLLVTIDPANRRIERWYDQRYSLLTMQAEETVAPNGSKAARVQEYKLTPDKRAVKEEWAYMALPSTGGTTNYSAEIMRSDVPQGSFWTWSPSGAITNARIDIRWYNKGFWLDAAEYTIYYRESGASRWTRYASKRHQHFRRGGGTDTWNIALSSTPKRYDIKVQVRLSPIWISSASAVGPGPAWMPRNAGEISKQRFEYHSLYPWLPTKSSVLGFGSSGEESATTYKYEDGRFLFPTSIETVVRNADSASATIRTEAQYDGFGRVARYNKYTVGDPSASASHSCFTYDEIGRLLTAERPAQSQTGGYVRPTYRRAYDDQNFIVTISDELNRKTRETYDGLGRFVLAEQEEAPGLWRQVAHVQYDSLGRLARQYDAFGVAHETKYEYDAFGRIIKTHYPMELGMSDYDRTFSESWSVDAGDLPASLYLPAFPAGTGYTAGYATAVRWEKENAARKASELEHSTYRGYDVAGRLIWSAAQTGPGSSDWSAACYRYDDLDRLEASWVYIQGNTWDKTSHEYGLHFDAPTAMALPGNGNPEPRHEYRYNSRGLKVAEDPGKPYAIWFGYDELGRLKTADYRDAAAPMSSKLFYDHDGRITRAELTKSGALQNETTATYNLRGWLVDETWIIDGEPYSMSYAYDDVGNRISMTYPNSVSFNFEYDNRNRLARIPGYFGPVNQPRQVGFTYDANGHLASSTSINGVSTAYATDAQGRLKSITATRQQPFENILQLGYSYTSQGNVSRISGINGGFPFELNYGYDRINRLTFAQVPRPGGMANVTYQYDGAGNRTVESWSDTGTVQYQYLPGNYLRTRGTTAYSWGPYGQLTSKTQGQTRTDYAYSAQRLMNEVKVDGAALAKYEYDAMGRRIKTIQGETTTITLHSGNDIVYEVRTMPQAAGSNAGLNAIPGDPIIVDPIGPIIEDPPTPPPDDPEDPDPDDPDPDDPDPDDPGTGDPPTSPVTEYDRLVTCYLVLNGKHLAKVVQQDSDPAEVYFCHTDMLGSIRAITDSSGEVAARFEYEPFGLVIEESGIAASGAERYTGKPYDQGIGFYFFGARYYDPEVGRFTSRDLAKDGLNWYAYCRQNPLVYVDPDGWKIIYADGSTEREKDAFGEAIEYLKEDSGTAQILVNTLEKSEEVIVIRFLKYPLLDPSRKRKHAYIPGKRTIEWCPNMGIRLKDGRIQSPALALAHEMGHAEQWLGNGPKTEEANLEKWETPIAKQLGEPVRPYYSYGHSSDPLPRTMGPTSREEAVRTWAPSGTYGLLY